MSLKNKPVCYEAEAEAERHEDHTMFWIIVIMFIGATWGLISTMESKTGQRAVQVLGDAIVKHDVQPAHEWWDERYSPVTEE